MRLSRCAAADSVGVVARWRVLQDLVAGQHQLADEVHQLVEQPHVDADAAVGDAAADVGLSLERAFELGLLDRRLC